MDRKGWVDNAALVWAQNGQEEVAKLLLQQEDADPANYR